MVEGTGLKKKSSQCHLQWHDLPAELYESLLVSSKVSSGRHTQTDRQKVNIVVSQATISFLNKVG
jgi:hypothetical protein